MSQEKLEEMQLIDQTLQQILLQKHAFQMELSETNTALSEIENANDEVYKIVGQLMIRGEKSKIKDELLNKQKIIDLRLKSLEKQESSLTEKLEKIRDELMGSKESKKHK
jgi:prefoldin beta subunit